jgi:hypothetical protein
MKTLMNTTALAVILAGGGLLAHPGAASATYFNPLGGSGGTSGGSGSGTSYCCNTGYTHCCYSSGCATKDGTCVRVVPAG